MKVTNTRVYGLEESVVASSYPMRAAAMAEVAIKKMKETNTNVEEFKKEVVDILTLQGMCKHEDLNIFEESKHFKRAKKLAGAKSGSGHDCFLKGIVVQCDIHAPQYFWQQWQRYHFSDIISSQSKMHCITKMDINKCVMHSTAYMATECAKDAINLYKAGEFDVDECLSNIPLGLEYTARTTMNYLQLKSMYKQRRTHRSKQWQEFCDWIETLPYAKEFILGE